MRPSINPYDSRVDAVTLTDLDNQNRIISTHRTVAEARAAQAELLYDSGRHFGDPELCRFRLDSKGYALASLAALNAHVHRWQYSRAEYLEIAEAVQSAVFHFLNFTPDVRDPDDLDDDPDADYGDDENIDADDEEPDDRLRDGTPYSSAYFIALGKPRDGEFEQRRPWVPATPADRRGNR
jgi:hypothetical protein